MLEVERALQEQKQTWPGISERVSLQASRETPGWAPERILLFGVGSSHYAARLVGLMLGRSESAPRVPVLAVPSGMVGLEIRPSRRDWAFGFSHRGRSGSTLEALRLCEGAGAFTAMIAGQGVMPSGVHPHVVLETTRLETVEPHTLSVTGAICAATSFILPREAPPLWKEEAARPDPSLDDLRSTIGTAKPDVILGEREGEWLAREAALKLMEMARLPARAFGTEEFMHGPRYSAEGATIWLARTAADRNADEIKAMRVIDVETDSRLAWVRALVTLQWMGLAVALNLGVNPDLQSAPAHEPHP